MGKFSFLFILSILLLLCVSAKMVTPIISTRASTTSKQDIETNRTEKIEVSDEEKNENEEKVKSGEFILTHIANITFLHERKINYLKDNTHLPTTYSKVLQQPPKSF